MGLFGQPKKKDPKEMVREWQSKLRKEQRQLDRQVLGINREEEKIKKSLKEAAKKGDKDVCNILGKEVVRARKAVTRIRTAQAQMKSVEYSMSGQLATLRVAGAMEKSSEVMASMSKLVNISEVANSMREMSKEMMKAGIVEEMMEDTFESLEDQDELEEDAQAEVDKVLFEITAGKMGEAPDAVADSLPVLPDPEGELEGAVGGADEEVSDMQARLEALRS